MRASTNQLSSVQSAQTMYISRAGSRVWPRPKATVTSNGLDVGRPTLPPTGSPITISSDGNATPTASVVITW